MDISSSIDFSKAPYFDDFSAKKGNYKILFKPGTPVQTRELNSIQSQIQAQIDALGNHLFKNGSMVIPGAPRFNPSLSYFFIDKVSTDTTLGDRIIGKYLTEVVDISTDSKLIAQVENWIDFGTKAVILVNYINSAVRTVGGEVTNKIVFSLDTELQVEGSTEVITTATVSNDPLNVPVNGSASTLSVQEGVYWVDGYFVHTPEQKIIVGYNQSKQSIKSGFIVKKSIVTAYDDESLYDNSIGSPNAAAPGADRFHIELELGNLPLDDEETNFIELIRLENGALRVANINPQYNVLADTLARRTFDESGDYAVHGFDPKAYEHLKDAQNPGGFLPADQGGDSNEFVMEISKGKGYVKGYEVENLSTFFLEVDKARTPECEKTANDLIQINQSGQYIYLAPGNQFFDISKHPIIWLTNGQESTAAIIGYCIPKYTEAINLSGQTIFKLYGTFNLTSSATFAWSDVGGWRLSALKNGPVLQVVQLIDVTGSFNVVDGLPLTSHPGYTPYAWDSTNSRLYVKKTMSAGVFDKSIPVVKGSASGYATNLTYTEVLPDGPGSLVKLSTNNVKTIKDALGNVEIQTDMALSTIIQTNASGYGEFTLLGDGIFVGQVVAANTMIDNAYFDNLVTIEDAGKKLVINNTDFPNSRFAVNAAVRKNISVRAKTLTEGSTLITNPTSLTMILNHKDVYRIKHIYVSADTSTAPTTSDEDIAKYYNLVNTDTIDFYNNTGIKAVGGFGVPAGQLLVVYDYFLHGAGDVFTVDSYVSLKDNIIDENDVTHIGRIPIFTTKDSAYILSDYLDFRNSVRDGFFIIRTTVAAGSNTVSTPMDFSNVIAVGSQIYANGFETTPTTVTAITSTSITLSEDSTYSGVVNLVVNAPSATSAAEPYASAVLTWGAISNSTVTYDATYFVDRWDRVVISKNGMIAYTYGIPGINRYPEIPADSMSLVTVQVPAYTRNANMIKYKKDENRRYTMRDIGKLEARISNLEYYTTLTLKELETKELKILDTEGLDRFKSGLFVMNFRDFGVFDPFSTDQEFKLTLVPEHRKLTPLEYSESIGLVLNETESTNFRIIRDKIFMPFTEKVEIQQPYATYFATLNPYLVIAWDAQLTLSPNSDTWVETEWAPTINNVTNIVRNTTSSSVNNVYVNTTVNELPSRVISGYYGARNNPPADTIVETRREQVLSSNTEVTTSVITETDDSDVETRLLGTSVIPFIRSCEVEITMTGAKPSTRYYARFDNIGVTQYCCPYNPETQVRGSWGDPLISDGMGRLSAIFQIPPATIKTGERIFEFSDVDKDATPDAYEQCVATATYTANGILETMQMIVNTINTITNNTHTTRTNNIAVVISRQPTSYRNLGDYPPPDPEPEPQPEPERPVWTPPPFIAIGDPLAQSFFTSDLDAPGMFVTKVNVFFSKKDNVAPAFLELKEVVNGYPALGRVPGSLVVVGADSIQVSEDATVPTSFVFDEPIYLQADREYAFVVGSNSARYAVWVARMGEKIINEERVLSEQPSLGSLFKSQNNSTWTPYQLEDIKFEVHRAQFDVNQSSVLVFENDGKAARRRLFVSRMQTTQGSNIVRIYHPNHGTLVNEFVNLYPENAIGLSGNSPAPTDVFNGIAMSDIYGTKIVKVVYNINEYGIEVPSAATVTGPVDDVGRYFYGESNINYNGYRLNAAEFVPNSTSIVYRSQMITGKDFDGGQTPQAVMPETFIKNNDNNVISDVGLVQIAENESTRKSVTITATRSTASDAVCPVMYLNKNAVTVSSLALDKPEVNAEDLPNGGSTNCKGVSQIIRLQTMSNSLRIYTAENKQENGAIEIWVRTAADREIESKAWQMLEPTNSVLQLDSQTYVEHERIADNLPEFDEYQIKVVFKGTNSVKYPSLNELRAISVAS
jgi:hypothetical protein